MAFRLIISEAADLTTIRVVGRLGDEAVTVLSDACEQARRPLVLDLSDVTGASNAGVLLLRTLASEGVHLLGASRYLRLLLDEPSTASGASSRGGARGPRRRGRPSAGDAPRRAARS